MDVSLRDFDEIRHLLVIREEACIPSSYSMVDTLVACELARALSLELQPNVDEGGYAIPPNASLIAAFKECIEYYLSQRHATDLIAAAEFEPELFLGKRS